jgi:hypothetical protein
MAVATPRTLKSAALGIAACFVTVPAVLFALKLWKAPPHVDALVPQVAQHAGSDTLREGIEAYFDGRDLDALALLVPHAAAGNDEAQVIVGFLYSDGLSGAATPNHCTAAYWLERAAHAGNGSAQLRLAEKYYRGVGVPRSVENARKWVALGVRSANYLDIDATWLIGYVRNLDPEPYDPDRRVVENAESILAEPMVVHAPSPVHGGFSSMLTWARGCHAVGLDSWRPVWDSLRCCRCGPIGRSMDRECKAPLRPVSTEREMRERWGR